MITHQSLFFQCPREAQPKLKKLVSVLQETKGHASLKYGAWDGNPRDGFDRWVWMEWSAKKKEPRLKVELARESSRDPSNLIEVTSTSLIRVEMKGHAKACYRMGEKLSAALLPLRYESFV